MIVYTLILGLYYAYNLHFAVLCMEILDEEAANNICKSE